MMGCRSPVRQNAGPADTEHIVKLEFGAPVRGKN